MPDYRVQLWDCSRGCDEMVVASKFNPNKINGYGVAVLPASIKGKKCAIDKRWTKKRKVTMIAE